MTISAISFSIMALCVKYASETISPFQVVFFRSFFGMLFVLPFIWAKRIPLWGRERSKLTLRGISGCLALVLHFYTIAKLELGLAVMLNYTAPIFAVILGVFFLKERPSLLVWLLVPLAFLGVVLLNARGITSWEPAVWLALLSSVFAAIAYVSIRTIKHRESPLTVIFYFTMISSIGSLLFLREWKWPNLSEWLLIAGVVIFSFYGQLWMTIALRRAPTHLVTPFQYLHPVLSFIYGWFLWSNPITLRIAVGVFLIILSGTLISFFETKTKRVPPPETLPSESSL